MSTFCSFHCLPSNLELEVKRLGYNICMNVDYVNPKVGAHRLDNEVLFEQHERMIDWMLNTSSDVVYSKFCMETAWFRELNWELQRRQMLVVH